MSNIVDYIDKQGKQINFAHFFVIIFFFLLPTLQFVWIKSYSILQTKNTLRDLSFKVGIASHFQAEESMDFQVDFFFSETWMANGSTCFSIFYKANGGFKGPPGERHRSDL